MSQGPSQQKGRKARTVSELLTIGPAMVGADEAALVAAALCNCRRVVPAHLRGKMTSALKAQERWASWLQRGSTGEGICDTCHGGKRVMPPMGALSIRAEEPGLKYPALARFKHLRAYAHAGLHMPMQ